MSETHLRFRRSGRMNPFLYVSKFRYEIDGIRVQDDGGVSVSLGGRILQTTAANISGVEPVDNLLLPIGVRRLPGSRQVGFVTDWGEGVRLTFRDQVRPAHGVLTHESAVMTIENPTELLPAILEARKANEQD